MNFVFKWADRVYGETDFGRSIATSVSGVIGLIAYLLWQDWVVAAFSAIIAFPIIRLAASDLHHRATRRSLRHLEREETDAAYDRLSVEEKEVVRAFVTYGGTVLTWAQANSLGLPTVALESLRQQGLIDTSMTADGMRETFVLDRGLFEAEMRRGK